VRELRIVLGWLVEIIGVLMFPLTVLVASAGGLVVALGNFLAPGYFTLSTMEWVKLFYPTLITLALAIFLTWLGLRLRRGT